MALNIQVSGGRYWPTSIISRFSRRSRLTTSANGAFWKQVRHAERRDWLLARARILHSRATVVLCQRFHRSATGCPSGFAWKRDTPAWVQDHAHPARRVAARCLSAYIAGICDEKAFGCRGTTDFFANRRFSQPRANGPSLARVRYARVVPGAHLNGAPAGGFPRILIALAAHIAGAKTFAYRGRESSPFDPPERMTVRERVLALRGIDLYDTLSTTAEADTGALAQLARNSGIRVAPDDDWSDIFSRILSERVEPNLGIRGATVLYAYPVGEAALAQISTDDPRVAEALNFIVPALNWLTLSTSFAIQLNNGDGLRRAWRSSNAFSVFAIPSTRISSRPWMICPTQVASRWGSTG